MQSPCELGPPTVLCLSLPDFLPSGLLGEGSFENGPGKGAGEPTWLNIHSKNNHTAW